MAKPRITRLGDPNNPYTKKPVSAEEARRSREQAERSKPKAKEPERRKPSVMDTVRAAVDDVREKPGKVAREANEEFNRRNKRRIDRAVDRNL